MDSLILQSDKALVGRDLDRPLDHFRAGTVLPANPEDRGRFKKKERLETQPKSILKHRIQTLTGQNMVELESRLGFDLLKDGVSMGVDDMRRLAHLLIKEANGSLDDIHYKEPTPEPKPVKKAVRRSMAVGSVATPTPSNRARRSLAPEAMRNNGDFASSAKKAALKRKQPVPELVLEEASESEEEEEEEEEQEEEDPNLGLDNPTPQMLALRRKSLAKKGTLTPMKKVSPRRAVKEPTPAKKVAREAPTSAAKRAARQASEPMEVVVAPSSGLKRKKTPLLKSTPAAKVKKVVVEEVAIPEPKNGFTGKAFKVGKGKATKQSEVFFVQGDPTEVSFKKLNRQVPQFKGANLSVVHTPSHWEPPEVFNVVQSIRLLNKEAGLKHFLVLVGCGLSNVHMFREALARQTQHVQFVVFERDDQNLEVFPTQRGKLRETTSFFLLAYFFPGGEKEGSILPLSLVRDGMTTCFRTDSVEDLENSIIHALSEPSDWLLDLAPRRRELTLAAQKSGRFAIAVDEDEGELAVVAGKARAIAEVMDEDGFGEEDGIIGRM